MSDPETLYHYTSVSSALKIIESRTLWATHVACLNDSREVEYGISMLRKGLEMLATETDERLRVEGFMKPEAGHLPVFNGSVNLERGPYVTCFSDRGDDLSMWRAYASGQPSPPCAIGFTSSALDPSPMRVEYVAPGDEGDALHRMHLVPSGIDLTPPDLVENGQPLVQNARAFYYRQSMFAGALVKHAAFRGESEFRVAFPPAPVAPSDHPEVDRSAIEFCDTNYGPTPYYAWKFPDAAVASVRIGPCPHQSLTQSLVQIRE